MPIQLIKGSMRYREDLHCFEARVTINYKTKSIYAKSKIECIRKANNYYKQNYKKIPLPEVDHGMYFNEWVDRWYKMYKVPILKPITLKSILSVVNKYIKPYFNKKRIKQITALEIDNFFATIEDSRHKETICQTMGDILNVAYKKDIIKKPIHSKITKYKHEREEGHCLTKDEEQRFLKNVGNVQGAESLMFAYLTGCRKQGVFNLFAEDIDFANRCIHIRETKTKESDRYIPITARLEQFLKTLNISSGKVFNISDWRCKRMIDELSSACGFRILFKDMRTTFATRLRESGVAPELVRKWLGHTSYEITEKYYVKFSHEFEQSEINKIDSATTQKITPKK